MKDYSITYACKPLNARLTVEGCEANRRRAGKKERRFAVSNVDLTCCLTCPGILDRNLEEGGIGNVIDHQMLTPPCRIGKGHTEEGGKRVRKGRVSKARGGFERSA